MRSDNLQRVCVQPPTSFQYDCHHGRDGHHGRNGHRGRHVRHVHHGRHGRREV